MKKLLLFILLICPIAHATTYYVDHIGGNRYSTNITAGLCDGTADTAPVGTTPNQHCAFNDVRYLWADGSYSDGSTFPGWGNLYVGGDTVIIKDCVQYSAPGVPISGSSGDCRIGYSGPNSGDWYGAIAGNPPASGMPSPPSGTSGAHTRILGANYASCSSPSAQTQIVGGYGTGSILQVRGSNYVDIECLNITDHSSCGRSGSANQCATFYPMDDYANSGIASDKFATNILLQHLTIHGLAAQAMGGPTGDNFTLDHVTMSANGNAGWNLDDGTAGTGHLNMSYMAIMWSGCNEEYPIVHAIPVFSCTDDGSGGYGDGWGTATVPSPGWYVSCDHCTFAYNTQDGDDALHVNGAGSTNTVTNSLFYGNMGNQLKIGGSKPTLYNNLIFGTPNSLRQAIPGTPPQTSAFTGVEGLDVGFTGTATSGSNVLTSVSTTTGIQVGFHLYDNNGQLPGGATVTAVGAGTITMSSNAGVTFTGSMNAGDPILTSVTVTSGTITPGQYLGASGIRPGTVVSSYDSTAHTVTLSQGVNGSAGTSFTQQYNSALSDFGRAGDDAIALSVSDNYTSTIQFNTVVTATSGAWLVVCADTCTAPVLKFQDNIFLGFLNNAANGYPNGGSGNYPERFYFDSGVSQGMNVFTNPGSAFSYNDSYHEKDGCPNTNETNALCSDPQLQTTTWSLYGYWPVAPASALSHPVGAGVAVPGITTDYAGNPRPDPGPAIGAYEFVDPPTGGMTTRGHIIFSGSVRF